MKQTLPLAYGGNRFSHAPLTADTRALLEREVERLSKSGAQPAGSSSAPSAVLPGATEPPSLGVVMESSGHGEVERVTVEQNPLDVQVLLF